MAEKIGEMYVEISAKADKLKAQFEDIDRTSKSAADRLSNNFAKASLRLNDSMAKKSITELEQLAAKLRLQLEKKIEMGAPLGQLEALKSSINKAESAVKTFKVEAEKPVQVPVQDQLSKWGMIASGIQSVIMTIRQFGSDMNRLVGQSIVKAATFEEMSSYFQGTTKDLENFKNAVKNTVGGGDLIRLSNQASDLGVTMKDQPVLFGLAKRAAEAYGTSVEEGFAKIVMATEGNVRGLKAVGIQKAEYTKLVEEMAKAHGGAIASLDAETQKEIRMQAILQLGTPIYEKVINNEKSAADEIESLGVAYAKAQKDLGAFILEGLKPLIKSYDEGSKGMKAFISSSIAIGGVIVGALPLLAQLITAKKMYSAANLMTAASLDKEAASAVAANVASKGYLVTMGIWGLALAGAGVVVWSLSENMHELGSQTKTTDDKIKSTIVSLEKLQGIQPKLQPQTTHGKAPDNSKDKDIIKGFVDLLANKEWTLAGKTADEISARIKALNDELGKLVPNTSAYKNKLKEIAALDSILKPKENKGDSKSSMAIDELKFMSADYYAYKIDLINKEAVARLKDGQDAIIVETAKYNQLRALAIEYTDFIDKRFPSMGFTGNAVIKMKTPEELANSVPKELPIGKEPEKKDSIKETSAQLKAQLLLTDSLKNGFNNAGSSLANTMGQAVQVFGQANSLLQQFINNLAQAVVQSLALAAVNWATGGILGMLGIKAHSGGDFVGTSSGVMKMASGGSFIVPPGYSNDRFPLMVESGERVSVTPANQVSSINNNFDASGIIRSIQILNASMINQNNRNKLPNTIGLKGRIDKGDIWISNDKAAKQRSRYAG